jgi:hypothetical protein
MCGLAFKSAAQAVAGLCRRHRHCEKRPRTKAEARASKRRLRDFHDAMAQVVWGPMHHGSEL